MIKTILTIIALGILGTFFLFIGYSECKRRKRFFKWKTMTVYFTEKKLKPYKSQHTDQSLFIPVVKYRYIAEGKEYIGSDIFHGRIVEPITLSKSDIGQNEIFSKFTDGIQGRYNPSNPGQSALFPAPKWTSLPPLVAGWIFTLIFVLVLLATLI